MECPPIKVIVFAHQQILNRLRAAARSPNAQDRHRLCLQLGSLSSVARPALLGARRVLLRACQNVLRRVPGRARHGGAGNWVRLLVEQTRQPPCVAPACPKSLGRSGGNVYLIVSSYAQCQVQADILLATLSKVPIFMGVLLGRGANSRQRSSCTLCAGDAPMAEARMQRHGHSAEIRGATEGCCFKILLGTRWVGTKNSATKRFRIFCSRARV